MTKLHKAAEQALRYLVRSRPSALDNFDEMAERHYVIEDLQEALAQQGEQQPVAWGIIASNTGRICQVTLDAEEACDYNRKHVVPLYAGAAPAAQPDTWTDDGGWTFPIERPTSPPEGYALISIDALKAWGKYDEVKAACVYEIGLQK